MFSRTSCGSGGRGREGDAEPAISQKKAIAIYGCDSAYWFYETDSSHLGALLLSLGKTLTAVQRHPEIHGFIARPISQKKFWAGEMRCFRCSVPAKLWLSMLLMSRSAWLEKEKSLTQNQELFCNGKVEDAASMGYRRA